MIWRYLIKSVSFTLSLFVLVFGGLQSSFVQNKLLNLLLGPDSQISFSKSSGFFPFDFSVKDLEFKNSKYNVEINNISIRVSSGLLSIKKVKIDKAKIISHVHRKTPSMDFLKFFPILGQKVVKAIKIKELEFGGQKIKKLKFNYDKSSEISCLSVSFPKYEDVLSASWRFVNDKQVLGNLRFKGTTLNIFYDFFEKRVGLHLNYQGIDGTFDGLIESEKVLTGVISIGNYKPNISLSGNDNGGLDLKFREGSLGLSGSIEVRSVDNKPSIFVNNLIFDSGIIVSPFTIVNLSKIPEVSILLRKGTIKIKNIDLAKKRFDNVLFSNIDISQFNYINAKQMRGVLSGTGTCDLKDQNKNLLSLKITNFAYGSIEIPSVDIKGYIARDLWEFLISFDLFNEKREIMASVSAKNYLPNVKTSKIDLKTSGRIDISKKYNSQRMRCRGSYELHLTGTLLKPSLDGVLKIQNGNYAYPEMGIFVRKIDVLCDIKNNNLIMKKIYLRDDSKKGGTVTGSGGITYRDKPRSLATNLNLKIDDFKIIDQNWLKANLFGSLKIQGNLLEKIWITGDLYTENPSVDISSIVLVSSRAIDIATKKKKRAKSKVSNIPIAVPVDVKFAIKPELKISGFGIDTLWSGSGMLQGDLFNLNYLMDIKLKSGKIDLTDNALKLKNGRILFSNNGLEIGISGEKKVEDVLVGVRFTQRDDSYNIDFYSKPFLSQRDIMSYLFFDKTSSEISVGEGITILTMANKLSGGVDLDILGKLKTVFGIDTISIKKNTDKQSGEEHDAISIGKKFGKFHVSVDQGSSKDTTNISVEAKVAKNAKVSVDLSGKNSVGAGILWSKRY